jgi:hypothetical protein
MMNMKRYRVEALQSNREGFVMASPKPALLVVERVASGPGPPWPLNTTFTPSFAPSHVLGCLPAAAAGWPSHRGEARGGVAKGSAL